MKDEKCDPPFLRGFYEKTESIGRQNQQRLERLIHLDLFRKDVVIFRRLRNVPAHLNRKSDWSFGPNFFKKFRGGKTRFFMAPYTNIVPPLKSKWFLSLSPQEQKNVRETVWRLIGKYKLPEIDAYFYWMFNFFIYGTVPVYPRSNVDYVNLKLPAESLSTGEKRLFKGQLIRAKKEDPWAAYEIEMKIEKALAEKRAVRLRKSQDAALKRKRSKRRTTMAFVGGNTFVPDVKKDKDFQKRYAAVRQASSRLKRRQRRDFGNA